MHRNVVTKFLLSMLVLAICIISNTLCCHKLNCRTFYGSDILTGELYMGPLQYKFSKTVFFVHFRENFNRNTSCICASAPPYYYYFFFPMNLSFFLWSHFLFLVKENGNTWTRHRIQYWQICFQIRDWNSFSYAMTSICRWVILCTSTSSITIALCPLKQIFLNL